MRVIFTCGGTAGHVNPALALAGYMKERHSDLEVLFAGTPNGIEKDLATQAGYRYQGIEISSFHRSFKDLRHNLHTVSTLLTSRRRANELLHTFRPDIVIGTGGYASYPTVSAAARAGIPTAVHESNAIPGLTTKLLEGSVDVIMVGFEDCRVHYKHPRKVAVTGTPVRGDFFAMTKDQARASLHLGSDRPLVVSFWGSLGASTMNRQMLSFLDAERADGYPFHHIHAVGSRDWEQFSRELDAGRYDASSLDVRRYIYDMAAVMRAADLVICRGGASTSSEVTALGVPAIIVPSPYVPNNHQEKNARLLEKRGGALVVTEDQATGRALYAAARAILDHPEKQRAMARAMASLGITDATERIYRTVMALL